MKSLFLLLPLVATLSPFYESISELQAILTHKTLRESFPANERIHEVIKDDSGYLIATENYQMQVDVIFQEQTMPGLKRFSLKFYDPLSLY